MIKIKTVFPFILSLAFLLSACVSGKAQLRPPPKITYLRSTLPPTQLFDQTRNFLIYYKGFNLDVSDSVRGLMVSDWMNDEINQRSRLTIRINSDVGGSLLTTHFVEEVADLTQNWIDLPSSGDKEAALVAELQEYLKHPRP